MKASTIKHIIITSALVMGAFFIGKSAQLNHSIPTEDIACWYTNADGYITVELKDITHQLDNNGWRIIKTWNIQLMVILTLFF